MHVISISPQGGVFSPIAHMHLSQTEPVDTHWTNEMKLRHVLHYVHVLSLEHSLKHC